MGLCAPVGVRLEPKKFNDKLVVRAGWGMYYDRGELYSYLSPGLTQNITNGGPFGINQQQPFVNTQFCPTFFPGPFNFCDGRRFRTGINWPTRGAFRRPPSSLRAIRQRSFHQRRIFPRFAELPAPRISGRILPAAFRPFIWAPTHRTTSSLHDEHHLDIQWQPRNDLAIDIGYVNGLGRHEVIPIPFNQARTASPTNPLCGTAAVCPSTSNPFAQFYTYGYTPQSCFPGVGQFDPCPIDLPNGRRDRLWGRTWQLRKAATSTCAFLISDMARSPSCTRLREYRLTTRCRRTSKSGSATASVGRLLHVLTLPG